MLLNLIFAAIHWSTLHISYPHSLFPMSLFQLFPCNWKFALQLHMHLPVVNPASTSYPSQSDINRDKRAQLFGMLTKVFGELVRAPCRGWLHSDRLMVSFFCIRFSGFFYVALSVSNSCHHEVHYICLLQLGSHTQFRPPCCLCLWHQFYLLFTWQFITEYSRWKHWDS